MNDKLVNRPPEGDPSQVTRPVEPVLPDKLAGKSTEEVADMYLNLERKMSEQALELGQLRRLTEATVTKSQPQAPPELDPDNPQPYIDHKVSEALAPIAGTLYEQKQQQFEAKLTEKHPDWQDVAGTDEFANWISESNTRMQIYQMADSGMDYEAASELIGTYKAINGLDANANKAVEKAVKREQKIRATATERGGTGNQTMNGKTIKRADIIALKQRNPEEYRRRQPEIVRAYKEGRVV